MIDDQNIEKRADFFEPSPENNRIYANQGNVPLINLMSNAAAVLDVGCGAGDNAKILFERNPNCKVFGITHSELEARIAGEVMEQCWVLDLEKFESLDVGGQFDTLIFSHVLEHLRDPSQILYKLCKYLKPGGEVLIAVPNVLSWRMRIKFLLGDFQYESAGVLDDTHLRFFTHFTADEYLLKKCSDLQLVSKTVTGSFPLWMLRRHIFPAKWCDWIDQWACQRWPNLFGSQILIKARKR